MATVSMNFYEVVRNVDALSPAEQKLLAHRLLGVLTTQKNGERILDGEDISEFSEDADLECPYCKKAHIIKWGFAADKVTRRYKCLDCNKSFRRTTNTVLSQTHKKTEDWETFILLTIKGATLNTCAKRCHIAISTAFAWRHKLLAALNDHQSARMLSGIVEMDETFFRVNFKGNHTKSRTFKMPRRAFKRGTPRNEHACVLCAVERGKQVYSEVVCHGAITKKLLERVLPSHIDKDSLVLTDALPAYKAYFKKASQSHKGLKSNAKGKGIYHINNINSYHERLKVFIASHYKNVSTKYLNNYAALFAWLENLRFAAKNDKSSTIQKALEFGNYRATKEFSAWVHDPALAPVA